MIAAPATASATAPPTILLPDALLAVGDAAADDAVIPVDLQTRIRT